MAQTAEYAQSEREKVESWRLHVLVEAGYPLELAERLAHSEADLHPAVELVRPELYEQRGDFHLRALTIERYGLGAHLAALERLKRKLATEGLFAAERKRPLPRFPSLIGLVTGNDAAAKRDVLTAITTRFPPAHVLVAETYVQGPRAAPAIAAAIGDRGARGGACVGRARGGGSCGALSRVSS